MVRSIAKRARLCILFGERHTRGKLHQRCLLLALWLPFAAMTAVCQQPASVSGTAKDISGGAIPEAKITLTNDKTAEIKSGTTDASGDFTFTGLAAGAY